MTALDRIRRTQRLLGASVLIHSVAWGLATTLAILAVSSFAALMSAQLHELAASAATIAPGTGVIVGGSLFWRSRHFLSRTQVALWIEDHIPDLQYSLITAMEFADSSNTRGMEGAVERQNISGVTSAAMRRRLLPPVGALGIAAVLLYVSPASASGRAGLFSRFGGSASIPGLPAGSRLDDIAARVIPPAYSGQRSETLDDPSTIAALVGSRIVIRGDGSPAGISASIPESALSVRAEDGAWALSLEIPAKPTALTLRDRAYERIIVLDPRADAPPRIVLTSPAGDTTLRVARLIVRLDAEASDDIGLASGYFEYLITSGSGEVFNTRTVTTPVVRFGGDRRGSLTATLDLASLKPGEGDVVSIRAIVLDGNTLSGPGVGTSDTRTFRLARASEYDSLSVDAAAPLPIDSSAMSQRMLVAMTERLVSEQSKLSRSELVKRSTEIGGLEDGIRKRVHEILFESKDLFGQEKPGEPPPSIEEMEPADEITEGKQPDLLLAYNALWNAVRSLQIAEPAPALPSMRVALRALDRVRVANRLYLRGMPPRVVVDLARVRMTGKEKGFASLRTPRSRADSLRDALERRFNYAVELLSSKPAEAVRTFTLIQVDALSVSPQAASALAEAVAAFRKGADATLPLQRARRALVGGPSSASGLSPWSGGW